MTELSAMVKVPCTVTVQSILTVPLSEAEDEETQYPVVESHVAPEIGLAHALLHVDVQPGITGGGLFVEISVGGAEEVLGLYHKMTYWVFCFCN